MSDFKAFIEKLCQASAEEILPLHASDELAIENKADESPVTQADRAAEKVMREMIGRTFPAHGIIGEEFGNYQEDRDYVWVLDPIDGTKSFITGVPLYGTLIGLLHKGQPAWGAIHQPVLKQLLIGNNQTSWLNDKPVKVREVASLDKATLLTTDPCAFRPENLQNGWDALTESVNMTRTWGDCYGYLLVACGWADIMLDPVLSPWDLLPLIPVMRGSGATITDREGNDPVTGSSAVVAHPSIHGEVLKRLNR